MLLNKKNYVEWIALWHYHFFQFLFFYNLLRTHILNLLLQLQDTHLEEGFLYFGMAKLNGENKCVKSKNGYVLFMFIKTLLRFSKVIKLVFRLFEFIRLISLKLIKRCPAYIFDISAYPFIKKNKRKKGGNRENPSWKSSSRDHLLQPRGDDREGGGSPTSHQGQERIGRGGLTLLRVYVMQKR